MSDIHTQASQIAQRAERISREKDAFLYICAWDRGDFKALCEIRDRASADKELEDILDGIDEELIAELSQEIKADVTEEENKRVHEKTLHLLKQYTEEV